MAQYETKSSRYSVTRVTPLQHDGFGINDSSFQDYEATYRPDVRSYYEQKPPGRESVKPVGDGPEDTKLNYKPFPLKWPFLLIVLLFVAGLIGAVEYACRTLPAETDRGVVPNAKSRMPPGAASQTTTLSIMPRQRHAVGLVRDVEAASTPTAPPEAGSGSDSSTTDHGVC